MAESREPRAESRLRRLRRLRRLLLLSGTLLLLPLGTIRAQSDAATGERLFAARHYDEARPRLAAAMRADSRDARSAVMLGQIELLEGDGAAATKWLERAVSAAPGDAGARWWLGRAYARQAAHAGRFARLRLAGRVKDAFERAVALDPDNVEARFDLLRFHLVAPRFAGGDVGRARAQAREIARRSAWRGHVAAGALAEKDRDLARAEREYRAAIAAAPDSAEGYAALGAMYERQSRWPQARALYDALLARNAAATVAEYHISRLAGLSGQDLARGAHALERYLAGARAPGDPSLASAWYRLGLVHQKQGDQGAAKYAFQRTLALDPKQDEARTALAKLR